MEHYQNQFDSHWFMTNVVLRLTWTHTFLKDIRAKWKAKSFIQNMNLGHRVYCLRYGKCAALAE